MMSFLEAGLGQKALHNANDELFGCVLGVKSPS